jgi:hypothetical protein
MGGRICYVIFDLQAEMPKSVNGTYTLPALYPTYGMAKGVFKRRSKDYQRTHEVREAELIIK